MENNICWEILQPGDRQQSCFMLKVNSPYIKGLKRLVHYFGFEEPNMVIQLTVFVVSGTDGPYLGIFWASIQGEKREEE